MRTALDNGEIDFFAIGSRYGTSALSLFDRLNANAFYCIANKDNPELINEIETVLQQLMFDSPTFEGNLNAKYFGHGALSNAPLYTKEELAFIKSSDTIKVKILIDQRPSCYMKDGKLQGIWPEYLKLISEKSGLTFELENGKYDDNASLTYEELAKENYLFLRTSSAIAHDNTSGIITSSPLMDIELSYAILKDEFVNDDSTGHRIALTKELSYVEPLILQANPDYQINYYDNAEDCYDAVINNKSDIAIQSNFRSSYLMQKPKYSDKLVQIPEHNYNNQMHLVATEGQEVLISIINKAISHISDDEKNTIVEKELLLHPYVFHFSDIWYNYWEWFVLIIIGIIITLVLYTTMTQRIAKLKIEERENEMLRKRLQLDEITELYNRTYFFEIAKQTIEQSNEDMCIVTMNIHNFKIINELYGMPVGDKLLIEIAQQLQVLDEQHNIIFARFASDHYYMCMPKRVFDKIDFPQTYKTFLEDIDVRVMYGVYLITNERSLPVNIMCDKALVAAREQSQNYVEYIHFYNDDKHQQRLIEQEIENGMEKALAENQFYIVIQPKFNPHTSKIVGGESLIRWNHPEIGIISPGLFIPVFEKNGFIIQLDYFVWEETCKFISKRKQEGKNHVPISINISRAHFYGHELINKLTSLIKKYNLEPKDLELEITESLCGQKPELVYDKIRLLQNTGFKIAMDDFGSGYSSLNMLKEMPLDIIKMDLKFLDNDHEKGRLILKALIEMAQTMELSVVVEGVELLAQVEFLSQFKDCILQGYYYSRPIMLNEVEVMLDEN
jgi:diguanylate cyclase (GGDEF)-like protein